MYTKWNPNQIKPQSFDLSQAPNRTPEQVRLARLEAEMRAKREAEVRQGKTLSGRN